MHSLAAYCAGRQARACHVLPLPRGCEFRAGGLCTARDPSYVGGCPPAGSRSVTESMQWVGSAGGRLGNRVRTSAHVTPSRAPGSPPLRPFAPQFRPRECCAKGGPVPRGGLQAHGRLRAPAEAVRAHVRGGLPRSRRGPTRARQAHQGESLAVSSGIANLPPARPSPRSGTAPARLRTFASARAPRRAPRTAGCSFTTR